MTLFLGIDGGGTKTSCVVGDDEKVLGTGMSSGSNIVRLGKERAREGVQDAIRRACDDAEVMPADIGGTCIGAAGISAPGVREALRRFVAELVQGTIMVVGDHEIAFEAAFGGGAGVLVAAGTGSIAFGRNEHGEQARAGGLGFAISDEGSGHWVGRTAVVQTKFAIDQGESTRLLDLIEQAWHLSSSDDLMKVANASPAPDFARLFPLVVAAAKEFDPIAVSVLEQAGAELARLAQVLVERLWPAGQDVQVATVGGVFVNSGIVRERFASRLHDLCPAARIRADVVDPPLGALSLARKCVS
jgi:N-acetylglucosamine kinase-like BadF-type ATPase